MFTPAVNTNTPYDDLERTPDAVDMPFLDTAPPVPFTFQPAQPPIAAFRQAAAASVNYTPADVGAYRECDSFASHAAEDAAHLAYVELTTEDFRELIGLGDLVLYNFEASYRFEGIVEELNFEADKAMVVWNDGFATRRSWLGFSRLTLILKKAARDVPAEVS